jgi:polyhydroxyalkanoate synthesis regulator phasin
MLDLIKKSIYLGLGVASVSKEKVEEVIDELIEKGQLSKEQKPDTLTDIMGIIEKGEENISKIIKNAVKETADNISIATKEDIENIALRVEKLESILAEK